MGFLWFVWCALHYCLTQQDSWGSSCTFSSSVLELAIFGRHPGPPSSFLFLFFENAIRNQGFLLTLKDVFPPFLLYNQILSLPVFLSSFFLFPPMSFNSSFLYWKNLLPVCCLSLQSISHLATRELFIKCKSHYAITLVKNLQKLSIALRRKFKLNIVGRDLRIWFLFSFPTSPLKTLILNLHFTH